MALLDDKAKQIAAEIKGENNPTVFIDPATILAIIGVIIQAIKLYKNCMRSPSEVKYHMDNIGWWNRWKLRRMIKASIKENNAKANVDEVYSSMLNNIRKTSVSDIHKLYDEVGNDK